MSENIQQTDLGAFAATSKSDPYSTALESILREMPYNSAMAYHRVYGTEQPDDRLGAACILQSIEAAARAHSAGAPEPILLHDDRHVAAIFDDPEIGIVVLDPYLLHLQPVVFPRNEVDAGRSAVEVAAAPTRTSARGLVRTGRLKARYVSADDGFVIRLSTTKFSPTLARYSLSRHFTLRSSASFDREGFTQNLHGLLTHPEQTSVSVRAVAPNTGLTAEAILPLQGYAHRAFNYDDIWLRDEQGVMSTFESADADGVWASLETMVDTDRKEIAEHLVGAARIYQSIADPRKDVAPYSTKNE